MANRKKTVEIDFIADTTKATRGIKQVGDTAEKQGGRFQKMGGVAKAGFAVAAVGVGILVNGLKDAVAAAAEDEAAQADLALALKNTVKATDAQIASTEKFITKTSLAVGVADDELRPALEELVRTTGDLGEAQDLLGVALDIAAAKGVSVEAVTKAMGKAALGNIGALGRLGIATKNAEGKTLTFEEAVAEANRTMGGAAETAAKTGAGAMARFGVVVEEFKEAIGGPLLDALAGALNGLLKFKEELETPGTQSFWDGLITNIKATEDAGKPLVEWFQRLDSALSIFEDTSTRFASTGLPSLAGEMDAARHAAAGQAGATDDLTAATEGLEGASGEAALSIDAVREAALKLFDPVFALADAERDLTEAVAGAAEAAAEHGDSSPEYLEALESIRTKALEVEAAERTLATGTGVTREQMENHLRGLRIFTEQQIDLMLAAYARHNAFVLRGPPSTSRQPTSSNPSRVPGQHTGGTVLGDYRGQEVLRTMRVGEHVSQGGRPTNGHGGTEIIQLVLDGRVISEVVRGQAIRDKKAGRSWG